MIVELTASEPPRIIDADRLDRLNGTVAGSLADARLDPVCRLADDHHVWVSVECLRAAAAPHVEAGAFDSMIEFAASKGWLDAAGTHVRAHVERAAGS